MGGKSGPQGGPGGPQGGKDMGGMKGGKPEGGFRDNIAGGKMGGGPQGGPPGGKDMKGGMSGKGMSGGMGKSEEEIKKWLEMAGKDMDRMDKFTKGGMDEARGDFENNMMNMFQKGDWDPKSGTCKEEDYKR